MRYKALLADLDDTLIKSRKLYDEALVFASRFVSGKYEINEEKFVQLVMRKHSILQDNFPSVHTRHSRILVFRMALEELKLDYDLAMLPKVEDMYWDYFLEHIEPFPGVLDVLNKIKDNGIKIAIVSDGDLSLRIRKAESSGVLACVDEVVASEEVVFEKPFSAIFTLALSRIHVDPKDSIMIGNNYKNDVKGAQLLGIRAGIFEPSKDSNVEGRNESSKEDFIINDFCQLLNEFEIE